MARDVWGVEGYCCHMEVVMKGLPEFPNLSADPSG